MNIIILGPQGSGKGTQAKLLAKKLNLVYLEMGDILRNLASQKTILGEKIAKFQRQGELVNDEIISDILKSFLDKEVFKKGILFDGFPRSLNQLDLLERFFKKNQVKIDKVIYLNISFEESIRRLTARRVCPKCGREFNLLTMPPLKENLCDDCGIQLIKRKDEDDEIIKKRLEIYRKETLPVIAYFRQKGILIEVNGEQPVETIFQEILKNLG